MYKVMLIDDEESLHMAIEYCSRRTAMVLH